MSFSFNGSYGLVRNTADRPTAAIRPAAARFFPLSEHGPTSSL